MIVGKQTGHNDIVIAGNDPGNILYSLTLADGYIVWPEVESMTAHSAEPGFKRNTSSG